MTTEDLHESVTEDPVGAVSALTVYQDRTSPHEGPTWGDALATLRETVKANPGDGLAILSDLDEPDPRSSLRSFGAGRRLRLLPNSREASSTASIAFL
jgi:hypothetical protein